MQTLGFKSLVSRLGLGTFKSRSRLEFLLEVSVSQRQCLVLVSKILAETPAMVNSELFELWTWVFLTSQLYPVGFAHVQDCGRVFL